MNIENDYITKMRLSKPNKSAFLEILIRKSRDFPLIQIHLSDEQEPDVSNKDSGKDLPQNLFQELNRTFVSHFFKR